MKEKLTSTIIWRKGKPKKDGEYIVHCYVFGLPTVTFDEFTNGKWKDFTQVVLYAQFPKNKNGVPKFNK